MAVTEESRYEVHKYFEERMGRERATTLMELLPPVGWGDVATKQDVLLLRQELKQDVLLVKQELKQDIGNLREWAADRFATKDDLHAVHVSLLREMRVQTMTLLTAMVALMGVVVGFG